jgi:hypothetical protein
MLTGKNQLKVADHLSIFKIVVRYKQVLADTSSFVWLFVCNDLNVFLEISLRPIYLTNKLYNLQLIPYFSESDQSNHKGYFTSERQITIKLSVRDPLKPRPTIEQETLKLLNNTEFNMLTIS